MKRGLLPIALAATLAGSTMGAGRDAVETRICASLEEASRSSPGPVLLVFFSTDCPICYDDLFEARHLVDKGRWPVSVVGVFSGLRDDLRAFLEKYAWTMPVVLDRRKLLFKKYKVDAVPFKTLLLGTEAVYRDDPYGQPDSRREELKRCLTRLFSR
ncbi:MAG: redoxin domain-containing protein [Candidatus Aminicenantes bacterium]|nr:redoxin domain-containing protein [Candidatus Aminicenantes bacterium]